MHPDQHGLPIGDIAFDHGEVLLAIDGAAEQIQIELAEIGGHLDDLLPHHQFLEVPAVFDQGSDAGDFEAVFLGKDPQFRQAGGVAVGIENLDDGGGGREAGQLGQIDRGLGVPSPAEHAARTGDEGIDMARLGKVCRGGIRFRQQFDGVAAVRGTDSGGDAFGGVDGDGVVGVKLLAVPGHHGAEAEPFRDFLGNGSAQHAAALGDHEVHLFRGEQRGRTDQVAFILPVLVIRDHHEAAGFDLSNNIFHGIEFRIVGVWHVGSDES